jgi:hypothetical protein
MPVLDPTISPNALAIASGAIVSALLDVLIKKGALTIPEVREALQVAMQGASARTQSPDGMAASRFIAAQLRHFSERQV